MFLPKAKELSLLGIVEPNSNVAAGLNSGRLFPEEQKATNGMVKKSGSSKLGNRFLRTGAAAVGTGRGRAELGRQPARRGWCTT